MLVHPVHPGSARYVAILILHPYAGRIVRKPWRRFLCLCRSSRVAVRGVGLSVSRRRERAAEQQKCERCLRNSHRGNSPARTINGLGACGARSSLTFIYLLGCAVAPPEGFLTSLSYVCNSLDAQNHSAISHFGSSLCNFGGLIHSFV